MTDDIAETLDYLRTYHQVPRTHYLYVIETRPGHHNKFAAVRNLPPQIVVGGVSPGDKVLHVISVQVSETEPDVQPHLRHITVDTEQHDPDRRDSYWIRLKHGEYPEEYIHELAYEYLEGLRVGESRWSAAHAGEIEVLTSDEYIRPETRVYQWCVSLDLGNHDESEARTPEAWVEAGWRLHVSADNRHTLTLRRIETGEVVQVGSVARQFWNRLPGTEGA